VMVLSCTQDAEAHCAAEIIAMLMRHMLLVEVSTPHTLEETSPQLATTNVVVVTLTNGLLRDVVFCTQLLAVWGEKHTEMTVVLADTHFKFPSPDFYVKVRQGKELSAAGSGTLDFNEQDLAKLATAFSDLLRILALPLSPQAALGTISQQISELCRRFRQRATRDSFRNPSGDSKRSMADTGNVGEQKAIVNTNACDASEVDATRDPTCDAPTEKRSDPKATAKAQEQKESVSKNGGDELQLYAISSGGAAADGYDQCNVCNKVTLV